MNSNLRKARTSIRVNVVTVCIVAATFTAGLAIGLQYYFGQSLARQAASDLYTSVAASIATKLRSVSAVNANVIDLLAANPALREPEPEGAYLEIFTGVLAKNPLYYSVYLGRSDGSFFEVINLKTTDQTRRDLQAMPSDRWLVITVQNGDAGLARPGLARPGRERLYHYLDENLELRLARSEPTDYDVGSRPWYTGAINSAKVQVAQPYIFAQLGVPGRTISKRVKDSGTVVAFDMTLSTISRFLAEQQISSDSSVYLFGEDGTVIASSRDSPAGSGETVGPTGNTASIAPGSLLVDIAANPQLREQLIETRLGGRPHLAYGAATIA